MENSFDQDVHVNAADWLVQLLDTQVGEPDVTIDLVIDQIKDAQAAFDGTSIDHPDRSADEFAKEGGLARADAREARHFSDATPVQRLGQIPGQPGGK
jgi:hypothetical protein